MMSVFRRYFLQRNLVPRLKPGRHAVGGLWFILLLVGGTVFSQSGEFFINNYSPKDYKSGNTNYGVVQNKEGLIFVANSSGVMIYDGYNWKLTKVPEEPNVTGICISDNNEVYIGCKNGDFGIFSRNKKGIYQYYSLRNNLPGKFRTTETIKFVQAIGDKVYFLSEEVLVQYHNGDLKTFFPVNKFHIRPMVMDKNIFVEDVDNNLLVLSNGALKPVLKSEELSTSKYYFSYKVKDNEFMIGFRGLGMFRAKHNTARPELTEFEQVPNAPCNEEFLKAEIVNGFPLRNGNFVVTSNKAGAFIIDKQLKIVNRLNSRTGVYDENIKSGFEDVNGNIWLALNYGISFVELQSPIRKFTRRNGINGLVESSAIYNNVVYIATDKGVFYFDSLAYSFKQLNNFSDQTWEIWQGQDKLFISTSKGLYIFDGKQIKPFFQSEYGSIYCMMSDPLKPEVMYCGHDLGVDIINTKDASLVKSYFLNSAVRSIAHDGYGNIYFGCETNGIYFLNSQKGLTLDSLQVKDGLPEMDENYVFTHKQKLLIAADDGIYALEKTGNGNFKCIHHPQLWPLTNTGQIFRASEYNGDIIFNQTQKNELNNAYVQKTIYIKQHGNSFIKINSSLSHLENVKANRIKYDSLSKIVCISCDEGLFILSGDPETKKVYNLFIGSVYAKKDTVIENLFDSKTAGNIEIKYSRNDIRIQPGFSSFEDNNLTEFSYYLEGKEDDFSEWRKDKEFIFSSLHEGDYTFHLKARNAFSNDIKEISFSFTVLPPWYRTWWAYTIYIIIFILFVYIIVRLNTRRLKAQNIKLEGVIKQRTATIEEQVHLLADQKKEITDSINYAQRIQESVLPSFKEINSVYTNGFIFFQPKDIVSGDFYWFYKVSDDEFLIACADCTGHGVPGAFMSMICSNKLTEACLQTNEPSRILFLANNSIKNVLKQTSDSDGKSKDGMEISLVRYDVKTRKIKYSGANRPLWIIKNGTKEFVEIKPTKASVASFTDMDFEYAQHEMQLDINDVVYMTSDGFPDQFGGPEGKKFMAKNMKQFLQDIVELPVDKQKHLVADKINSWKGSFEQVDDLLVIGIKAS
ncbi:MAG: protein serine/threonine phosphatase [Bacteroidetes bacterium]|jgi:serine phosphatase RsbU (regulator of sigma subunit)/ligand-binding sensor domain-containing protein|nr:protein serine/threonine phosphatase [Bacteroidota bacterium]